MEDFLARCGDKRQHLEIISRDIEYAASKDDPTLMKLLLTDMPSAVSDHTLSMGLQGAVLRGHLENVNFMLNCGANIEGKTRRKIFARPYCCSPLQYAVHAGYLKLVLLLLGRGANVNTCGASSRSGLDVPQENGTSVRALERAAEEG